MNNSRRNHLQKNWRLSIGGIAVLATLCTHFAPAGGPPNPPGGGATNDPGDPLFVCDYIAYSAPGLKLFEPIFQGTNLLFHILEPEPGAAYDLFFATNASITEVWSRRAQGTAGQTNFLVPDPFTVKAFFQLGTSLDSDGDGVTDAYELLVAKTDPFVATLSDTDGDLLPNGWESLNGFNPNQHWVYDDSDTDNINLYNEYLGGTDPNATDALTLFVSTPRGASSVP